MKNLICVFLLQLMILGCNALQAQWVQTSGPGGGNVSCLAVSPNGTGGTNLVAGTDGALFLSTNYGTSWTAVDSGLTDSHGDCPFIGAVVFSVLTSLPSTSYTFRLTLLTSDI